MDEPNPPHRVMLLGRDHSVYGDVSVHPVSDRAACAISVGSDAESPSLRFKGDPDAPNEDAVLVVEQGDLVALAVSDAHLGNEASHEVLAELFHRFERVPTDPPSFLAMIDDLAGGPRGPRHESRASLVVAIHDRGRGTGFGLSWGDSTFVVNRPGGRPRGLNRPTGNFVALSDPRSLAIGKAEPFTFQAAPGDLLIAFTDGVNECHYTSPETSITPDVLAEILADAGPRACDVAEAVVRAALAGAHGNPGGQDNVAVAVAIA